MPQAAGKVIALVIFKGMPKSVQLSMASHMQSSLAFSTISNPGQHEPSGLMSFDPSVINGTQSAMPNMMSEHSSVPGGVPDDEEEDVLGDIAMDIAGAWAAGSTTRAQLANARHVVRMHETKTRLSILFLEKKGDRESIATTNAKSLAFHFSLFLYFVFRF